tara:strand:- start:302 stop:742 length:441 start_codon:yes stop_codon:yes gene_type:complete
MIYFPDVWGPHYWFFLHTISLTYPINPNKIIKKKYYDLIMNFPLFIPIDAIGNSFSKLLDKYPIQPYLDSRESFIKWVHFIHNQINIDLDKPTMEYQQFLTNYYDLYKPKPIINQDYKKFKLKLINIIIILLLLIICIYLYKINET